MSEHILRVVRGLHLLRIPPRVLIWGGHLTIFLLAALIAFLVRFEFQLVYGQAVNLAAATTLWVVVKSAVFAVMKLDRGWWQHVSLPDMLRVGKANFLASAICAPILYLALPNFPRSVIIIDFLLCTHGTAGIRVLVRLLAQLAPSRSRAEQPRRVVIYGAGSAGVLLLRELQSNALHRYQVVGFVDDNRYTRGMYIERIPVLGGGDDLAALAQKHPIDEVLIAIPSASGPQMTKILQRCHEADLRCKTVPGLASVIDGPGIATQIRDVAVEDLLGRNPARLDDELIAASIQGKVVAVTGAAGSIGSELCRQLARFRPHAIVAFDAAETPLFYLEREMRQRFADVRFYPEMGSIQNRQRLREVFRDYAPSIVYHAAAYKHVPLMEHHVFEAVENNVFGTYNAAAAAAECGVEQFVMISSDKAVRPTNIMGLTKRVAELVIRSMQNGGTKFVSVRFGNVLGSNGSVIPLFKEQIAKGGPVVVTHPEMRRYFMTIPEAAQLVLQAATMGRGGDIFVLEMGEAVKILDLARNLILLSGLRPDVDVKIEFSGPRPGEKLYEELSTMDEETARTHHEKIRIFTGHGFSEGGMDEYLQTIRQQCRMRDHQGLILTLKELVPEYNVSSHVLRELIRVKPTAMARAAGAD